MDRATFNAWWHNDDNGDGAASTADIWARKQQAFNAELERQKSEKIAALRRSGSEEDRARAQLLEEWGS